MATRGYDRAYNEFYLNNAMNTLATMLDYAVNIKREDIDSCFKRIIFIDVSSSDGTVTDVYFSFSTNDYYAQIPPEVYREMELRFKNEIQVELTNEGRKVDHCSLAWLQCPKGRDNGLTIPEGGGGMLTMPSGKLDGTIGGTIGTPSTTPTMP